MFAEKRPSRYKNAEKGFTLIELLIVMIILSLLAALVPPRMFQKIGSAKQKAPQSQIALFGGALEQFRLDAGRYPTTQEGLEALRKNPGVDHWDGPYLPKEVPGDPWGKPYLYRAPGEHGDYDIASFGADGQDGGDGENADVLSWN